MAIDSELRYDGHRREGIVVVNELQRRGRLAEFDLFDQLRQHVPITVAVMKSAEIGGIGEIHYRHLHRRVAEYRFLFSPMRYSSLPLCCLLRKPRLITVGALRKQNRYTFYFIIVCGPASKPDS